jgi:hypothetical protein
MLTELLMKTPPADLKCLKRVSVGLEALHLLWRILQVVWHVALVTGLRKGIKVETS